MDPITAAALAALAAGVGGEAGRHAWQGLSALVRRPFRRGGTEEPLPGVSSSVLEVASLEEDPTDPMRAQALATALGVRAALDSEFRGLLEEWWRRAQTTDSGSRVHNNVSGGTQQQVFQGQHFPNVTLNFHRDSPPTD